MLFIILCVLTELAASFACPCNPSSYISHLCTQPPYYEYYQPTTYDQYNHLYNYDHNTGTYGQPEYYDPRGRIPETYAYPVPVPCGYAYEYQENSCPDKSCSKCEYDSRSKCGCNDSQCRVRCGNCDSRNRDCETKCRSNSECCRNSQCNRNREGCSSKNDKCCCSTKCESNCKNSKECSCKKMKCICFCDEISDYDREDCGCRGSRCDDSCIL